MAGILVDVRLTSVTMRSKYPESISSCFDYSDRRSCYSWGKMPVPQWLPRSQNWWSATVGRLILRQSTSSSSELIRHALLVARLEADTPTSSVVVGDFFVGSSAACLPLSVPHREGHPSEVYSSPSEDRFWKTSTGNPNAVGLRQIARHTAE